jgi:hypothetical protein
MALTTRVIAGILKDANGTLLTSTTITLTPASFYGEGGVMIVPQAETLTTDGSGAYTVTLQCPSSGHIAYQCVIGPQRFNFDLESGAATSLDELFNYAVEAESGGGGGTASVTSTELSATRAALVSADAALSARIDGIGGGGASVTSNEVSVIAAALSGRADSVNTAVETNSADVTSLKAVVSNAVSAIQANSADVTSLKDRVSVNSAMVSNAVSAIQANSASNTSSEAALSARIDAVSNALSGVVAGGGVSVTSNEVSVIAAGLSGRTDSVNNRVSANSAVVSNAVSAIQANSADVTSLKDRVSANSALLSTVASALSARIDTVSQALSAKKLSSLTDVSVTSPVSSQVLVYKSADAKWTNSTIAGGSGSVTSAEHLSALDRISALSVVVSNAVSAITTNSADVTSLKNRVSANSALLSERISAIQANSADVTSLKDRVSANSAVLSNALSAITANSAQMTSAIATKASIASPSFTTVVNVGGPLQLSGPINALKTLDRASAESYVHWYSPTQGVAAIYVDFGARDLMLLSSNAATFDTNLAITSGYDEAYDATNWNGNMQVPTKNAVRDIVETVRNDISAKKLSSLGDVSVTSPVSAQFLIYKSADGKWTNSTIAPAGASVTSAEHLSALDRISALSVVVSNAVSAITTNSADVTSLKNRVSANSAVVSDALSAIAANSADVTSLKNRVSANSALLSERTSAIVANSADVTSLKAVVSNAISAITTNSADVTSLKNRVSANSAALSVAQGDITSIKNNISAIPTSVFTFTNKRITKRVAVSVSATGGVVTPNFDNFDMNIITAQGAALSIAAPAGTATEGQSYVIRIRDDGTGRSINYNAIYRAFAASLPTITSASKTLYLGMMRNSTENTYDVDWVTQL